MGVEFRQPPSFQLSASCGSQTTACTKQIAIMADMPCVQAIASQCRDIKMAAGTR